jgi:hypothetical protein
MTRYVLRSSQLAMLERCLTVVYRAANWLPEGGIFWMGKMLFAADHYASVGLGDSGLEVETEECLSLTSVAIRKLLSALRNEGVRFMECIEFVPVDRDNTVNITVRYEKDSGFENRLIVSQYHGRYIPEVDIASDYSLFRSHKDYREYELYVEKVLHKTRCRNDTRFSIDQLVPLPSSDTLVSVDMGALKAFLAPARSEDTTMLLGYCGAALPILARAGDVIAVMDTVI